jgi:hypothetical protein
VPDEVLIAFQRAGEGLFKAVRLEEEIGGHLRRAREDLEQVGLEAVVVRDETLYRIKVAADDDVAGHAARVLVTYRLRRPQDDSEGRRGARGVSGDRLVTPGADTTR